MYERSAAFYDVLYAALGKDFAAEAEGLDQIIRERTPGARSLQAVSTMSRHLAGGGVLIVDGWVLPHLWLGDRGISLEYADTDDLKVARMLRTARRDRRVHLEMHYLGGALDDIDYFVEHHERTLFERDQYEAAFRRAGLAVETTPSPMAGRDRYIGSRR